MDIVRAGAEVLRSIRGRETIWTSAKARYESGELVDIAHSPKFKIDPGAPIFTMGSCFTRVIEDSLIGLGYTILLENHGLPSTYFVDMDEAAARTGTAPANELNRNCFNKFNVHSMSHEVRRVLEARSYEHEGLIELVNGQWFDPHASFLRPRDLETALRHRQEINRATARIKEAAVVIFTLGLTETWIDTVTGLSMNLPPHGKQFIANSERFQFVDYGYESILAEFLNMVDLIRRTCNPDMKFVLTVSPIPMAATWRLLDVMVAHTASKSVLRAVADEAQRQLDCVDYFPAYEIVTHSPRNLVWQTDQLHVVKGVTQHIARQFVRNYGLYQPS